MRTKKKRILVGMIAMAVIVLAALTVRQRMLLHGCDSGSTLAVRIALWLGADPDRRTHEEGVTPLHYAARSGNPRVVRALLSSGADATIAGSWDEPGRTRTTIRVRPRLVAKAFLDRALIDPDRAALFEAEPQLKAGYEEVIRLLGEAEAAGE